MSPKPTPKLCRAVWVLIAAVVILSPGTAPAVVNPVTLIQRQVVKPNMLIVFDTSTSMIDAPGELDHNAMEVGMDCVDGDADCRMIGTPGRCYFSGTGAMGSGVTSDNTSCHNNTECRTAYCSVGPPKSCDKDSDCGTGNYCQGWCSNNNSTSCTKDSSCGTGNTCRGLCSNATKTLCTQESDCTAQGSHCTYIPTDVCITSGSPERSKTCALGQNRCRTDSDCTAYSGDTCGPASSRMMIAKKVVSAIVSNYYNQINFGLMTFSQTGYYPYYPTTGSVTNTTVTRFVEKDVLKAFDCWDKYTGPTATCTISGQVFTRKSSPNSKYRVRTGGLTQTYADADWCSSRWCPLPASGGTGFYLGSYYTFAQPSATVDTSSPSIESSYQGKMITKSGVKYIYWDAPNDVRNKDNIFGVSRTNPISNSGTLTTQCCATCGGIASTKLAPFMDTSDSTAAAKTMADAIIARMDKSGLGGLVPNGGTPTGCSLSFDGSTEATDTNNAFSYLAKVKTTDPLANCRNNYVLLITDGAPNGGFDVACESAACSAADPTAAGCTCLAVRAAQQLKNAGIRTYVVGFSASLNDTKVHTTMNNMAKAGGTTSAYLAVRESDLKDAIVNAIYDAAQGSYSTSPAAASQGVQNGTSNAITLGSMVLDTRVDFPGWKGQLIAYETSSGSPTLAWSASTVAFNATADPSFWKKRNVWTSSGTTMVKFDVDQGTGAINNKHQLATLGLGATDDEAERVARWMLGDPAMKNPAVLGAIINSTPIDVGPPGKSPLPGGTEFYDAYATRPNLVYAGSSDGMLHAFFTRNATVGSKSYVGGQEAFAYIPQTMLAVQAKLFAQGGQLPDPKDHVYGLANSPKVKSLCTQNCDGTSNSPVWKTILAMAYGYGGTEAFTLDITNPFDGNGVKTSSAPAPLMWSTQYETATTTAAYDNDLGLTTSVPAFYYGKSASKDDFRLIFGSYYDTGSGNQGKTLINASAATGTILQSSHISPSGSCGQVFGLMSDVATARNFAQNEETQILAAYFGDTWGNAYRYVPTVGANNYTGTTGSVGTANAGGCNYPIHYAPTVVQLDRDNSSNHPGEIYLVQVTNSALDDETKSYPASTMTIRRDLASGGTVTNDSSFAPITLTAGVAGQLCGVTNAAGTTCTEALPATARPNATPMAVLKQDGTGFVIVSTWYLSPANACTDGTTYLIIQEYTVTNGIKTKFSTKLASEPVTSAVFVGGKLMFVSQTGVTDLTTMLPAGASFTPGTTNGAPGAAERVRRLGWMEVP